MKRFIEHKITTAQILDGVTTPVFDKRSVEGQIIQGILGQTDEQRKQSADKAIEDAGKKINNSKSAISIYTSNGKSEEDYNQDIKDAMIAFSVPNFQWDQYIIGFWPMLREKNISFNTFLELLGRVCQRLKSPADVDEALKSLISVFPNLSKTMGTSDEALYKALDFLTSGKSADEFQKYLLYHMVLRYGLYREIPEDKRSDIIKATETLEKLRSDVSGYESEYLKYLHVKNIFLSEQNKVNQGVTLALMAMQKQNYQDLTTAFRQGISWNKLGIWLKLFKDALYFSTIKESTVLSGGLPPEAATGVGVGTNSGTKNYVSDKVRRRVFAEENPYGSPGSLFTNDSVLNTAKQISEEVNVTPPTLTAPPKTTKETTDSGAFAEIYGENYQKILFFETVAKERMELINKNIEFVLNKSASPTTIGPFQSGSVFQYLQNEKESLEEIERVIGLVDDVISGVSDARSTLIETIGSVDTKDTVLQRKNAKIAIEERFGIFIKDARSKQLGLKFNGVLIENENAYSEAEDLYENVKVEMESNVSARPVLAPKAILAGFRMADILENIANRFKEIAGLNPFRAEQAKKTARRFENFAKQQRAFVFKDIYPGMAASIGIEATKPSISPSLSLRGAADADMFRNIRLAGKFMDKEVESDKKFRDYWNNLFMQSKDPRPMGDIIEEKPKHGNLTTEEDAKLHKKTMRKFKKPAAKSRFKKN
jgi:hypothetical protein